jgi:hypothetical protein
MRVRSPDQEQIFFFARFAGDPLIVDVVLVVSLDVVSRRIKLNIGILIVRMMPRWPVEESSPALVGF